jgi:hypothetical protein
MKVNNVRGSKRGEERHKTSPRKKYSQASDKIDSEYQAEACEATVCRATS